MEQRPSRQRAAEILPVTTVSPARQMVGGGFLVLLGAALTLFPAMSLRMSLVIGVLVGIGLYMAVRTPVRRTGVFASGMVAVDQDGIVRVVAGLRAVTRASRQFTDRRHFRREILLGIGIVAAYVAICIVLVVVGVGLVCIGMLCAVLGMALAEGGLGVIRVGRIQRATRSTMLDGVPMIVLLAAYLHLSGRLDEIEAGVPADVLVERISGADDQTLLTARRFIDAWAKLQHRVTHYGGV